MTIERIFVLDSLASSREAVISALRSCGHEATGASIDRDTFDIIRSAAFDLLVVNGSQVPNPITQLVQPLRRACPNIDILLLCDNQKAVEAVSSVSGVTTSTLDLNRIGAAVESVIKKRRDSVIDSTVMSFLATPLKTIHLLAGGESVEAIAEFTLRTLATEIGADYISVRLLNADQDAPQPREKYVAIVPPGAVSPAADAIERRVIATASSVLFLDGVSHDAKLDQELLRNSISSGIGLPLVSNGRLTGIMVALVFAPNKPFSQNAVSLVSMVAASFSLAARQSSAIKVGPPSTAQHAESQDKEREEEVARLREAVQTLENGRREAQQQFLQALRTLTGTIDAREPTRRAHSQAVEQLAVSLAERLRMPEASVASAALLHNVGMLAVPDPILSAKRSLSKKEWLQITNHPLSGEELARNFGLGEEVVLAIRHHHENWDGTGYPDGLSGEKIPPLARLLRVVDTYIAIRSPRPWRKAFEPKEALHELQQGAGKLFDPIIVTALIELINTRPNHVTEMKEGTAIISTLSHEIRSPLTSLVSYSEVLAMQPDLPSTAREAASEIKEEALYLSRLVETLLNFSREGMVNIRLNRQPVDLEGLIRSRLRRYEASAGSHEFIEEIPDDLPILFADPDRIIQVLTNLIDNAVKYSPEGGRVKVSATHNGTEVEIGVEDEGIGIPEADKDRIFELFYRIDSDAVRNIRGSGLGLAICKKVIEAHGGRIWASSPNCGHNGKGSVFKFTLPIHTEA